jgi:squalene synthase HpnC
LDNHSKTVSAFMPGESTSQSPSAIDVVRHTMRHYENFNVISYRQSRRMKDALAAIYAYCRYADDVADESESPGLALSALDQWEEDFNKSLEGSPRHPILEALADTIYAFHLPPQPFRDLLTAFRQDQKVQRYQTFQDLLQYCSFSADPVGRIVLALFGYNDERFFPASDAICTGLQLANLWQDVDRDAAKGRIYIPLDDLAAYSVTEDDVLRRHYTADFKELMIFEGNRARGFFDRGKKLVGGVGWNLRWEIEMFRRAGIAVLDSIERVDFDVLHHRPTISRLRKVLIAVASLPALFWSSRHGR